MKEQFINKNFRIDSLDLIEDISGIVEEYQAQGFVLTVRQLYYQLVARDRIPNTERSYKNTVNLVNNARLAGYLDWDAIEDRTRSFKDRPSWLSGASILTSAANSYHTNMWANQDYRVFCIIEKEALSGVLSDICWELDIPLLSARGYPSASVLYDFGRNTLAGNDDKQTLILHLGDHDPSGIDMTRDLEDRLSLFSYGSPFELRRIALTMEQIRDQKPPPNPAKVTDSRFREYARRYGNESWELDALQPSFLANLVREHTEAVIDQDKWDVRLEEIDGIKKRIRKVAKDF